jgi:hypothetical protein
VYLIFGFMSASAVAVFVALAEEIVAGGKMAVVDVVFGQAPSSSCCAGSEPRLPCGLALRPGLPSSRSY